MQFTKLFNSILDSTIWQEPKETKLLWITLLAMCDRNGDVYASVPGLAVRAGISIEECEAALECLMSPDKYSRTKDHDGRRIAEIDGGWTLLNHGKYREMLSHEERKEYNRRKQQERRERLKSQSRDLSKTVNDKSMTVIENQQCQHIAEAEAEADTEADNNTLSPTTRARARKEEPLPEILRGEKPETSTKTGFPEKSTALDYAAKQNWPEKSALSWWLHRDSERSTGEARFRDPNWHWWSDLERWVLNDARTGGGSIKGGEKLPRGARTAGGKRTILDYQPADEWTEENLRL